MAKTKKLLLTGLSVALVAIIAVFGTVAFFTDTDEDTNVMTIGNVQIVQNEQDRFGNDFEQKQALIPLVTPTGTKDTETGNMYPACENYIDKIVTVSNTGETDAYVRTFIAIPQYTYEGQNTAGAFDNVIHWNGYSQGDASPNYPAATRIPGTEQDVNNHWSWGKENGEVWPGNYGEWNSFSATIKGQEYTVMVVTHLEPVAAGTTTAPNLLGLYLDSKVDFDGTNYTYEGKPISGLTPDTEVEVLVATQAVQANGFSDAWTALNTAFYTPDANNHPWLATSAKEAISFDSEKSTYDITKDAILTDEPLFSDYTATKPYTINGNGNTVTMVATDEQTFDWTEGGTIPLMAMVFSSENGEQVTVNDLTITGTMQSVMAGNYVSGNAAAQSKHNTVFNSVNIVNAQVVSLSANISPALSVYGTLTMNNCNVYGSTLSPLDTDPMWPVYDMAVVNYSDTTLNNSKVGSIFVWNHAKVTVAKDSVIDTIVIRGNMNTTKYGVTIKAGATVGTIDLSAITDKSKVNIPIEDGATVGKIVANGVEYDSIAEWKNAIVTE